MCDEEGIHPTADHCAKALIQALEPWRALAQRHPARSIESWIAYGRSMGFCT